MKQQQADNCPFNDKNNQNNKGNKMMMPDNGGLDIDGLCKEMQDKARCSETGLWYDKEDVKNMMATMGKTTMPT